MSADPGDEAIWDRAMAMAYAAYIRYWPFVGQIAPILTDEEWNNISKSLGGEHGKTTTEGASGH